MRKSTKIVNTKRTIFQSYAIHKNKLKLHAVGLTRFVGKKKKKVTITTFL